MSSDCYDFIIVGAGSAGCVLADRLTACGRYKVLLVEAGGTDNRFWIKVPLGYAKTFHDARVNWRYTAAADPGLNGRRAYWPRGRVIGGSSSINAMAYLRGLPHDFDDWAAAGATGWGWDTARQIYETLETQSELTKGGARRLKGSGPLWVSEVSDRMHPFSGYFLQAAQDMGWPLSQNLNSDQTEGVMRLRSTAKGSRRWSAADAFLRPAMTRKNLRVISCAHVEKVLIKDRVAQGIRYRIGDTLHEARAAKEVILSAGAVNSPQLLQLSGVGPADLLRRHQIKVHHALPQVGQGLQDHLGISYFFRAAEPTLNNILGNWLGKAQAGLHYL
ncbi:MAG: GMC family oxidoreductase, partial [Paracoccaceae bacterium]